MIFPSQVLYFFGVGSNILVHDVDGIALAIVDEGFNGTGIDVIENFIVLGEKIYVN